MSKRVLAVFFVFLLSVTLVGSVLARPRVSGRFSVGSAHLDGDATDLRGFSDDGVTIVWRSTFNGVALCRGRQGHYGSASTLGGNHDDNNNDSLVRGNPIEGVDISRTLFIPPEDIHRGSRATFHMDIEDTEINEAVLDLLDNPHDACPRGTRFVKLEINTFAPTLVLIEGEFGGGPSTLGGRHHDDNQILDETTYDCRVNYRQRPNRDGTRTATCRIVNHKSR